MQGLQQIKSYNLQKEKKEPFKQQVNVQYIIGHNLPIRLRVVYMCKTKCIKFRKSNGTVLKVRLLM